MVPNNGHSKFNSPADKGRQKASARSLRLTECSPDGSGEVETTKQVLMTTEQVMTVPVKWKQLDKC